MRGESGPSSRGSKKRALHVYGVSALSMSLGGGGEGGEGGGGEGGGG